MPEHTIEDILNCPALPSLPAVAVEVLELTKNADVDLKAIAQVVQRDPAISAKILKTVNSSYYGLSKPCPTIMRALTYLGLNTVKALVLGFSLVDITKRCETDFDFIEFWRRGLSAAAAARRLAARKRDIDPEEAFVAALMQDIGMLAMQASFARRYGEIVAGAEGDHRRLPRAERTALGFDHAEVGGAFASRWRLPDPLVAAIRHHVDPDRADAHREFARIVGLASDLVVALGAEDVPAAMKKVEREGSTWFGLRPADLQTIAEEVLDDAQQLAGLFKIPIGDRPTLNRMMLEAQDRSVETQIAQQREVEELQSANDALAQQASTDALTRVGNRVRFDTSLAERFEQAVTFDGTMGLLFVDIDHFKQFNDTYGHQAGDDVLVELASRMVRAVRRNDVVCRYGGEEFGVVLPGADQKTAVEVGERLRLLIASEPMIVRTNAGPETPVSVTASVGVAVRDGESARVLTSPEILVKAADRALYAAKAAGRNRVLIFRARAADAA